MNRRLILRLQGAILALEAILIIPSLLVSLYYGDGDAHAFRKPWGFCSLSIAAILIAAFILPLETQFGFETHFTAALASMSDIGPGFGRVGPMDSFAAYGRFSKLTLTFLMLLGRLEIYPMLALLHPAVWKKQ